MEHLALKADLYVGVRMLVEVEPHYTRKDTIHLFVPPSLNNPVLDEY